MNLFGFEWKKNSLLQTESSPAFSRTVLLTQKNLELSKFIFTAARAPSKAEYLIYKLKIKDCLSLTIQFFHLEKMK